MHRVVGVLAADDHVHPAAPGEHRHQLLEEVGALDDLEDRAQLAALRELGLLEDVDDAVGEDVLDDDRVGALQELGHDLADARRQRRQLRCTPPHSAGR